MTIDGLTLNACVKELQKTIIGAKVEKVFQPLKDEIGLALRTQTANVRLLISLSAGDCRIHLTNVKKENPPKPPTFCMLLRKYLTMSRINDISQVSLERIVKIAFEGKDELGLSRNLVLICEFMGKYSNIILTDAHDKILGSAKAVPFGVSSVRQVLPGITYTLPPSTKLNPLLISSGTFFELLTSAGKRPFNKFLVQTFQGVSSQTADELNARFRPFNEQLNNSEIHRLVDNCIGFFADLEKNKYNFTITFNDDMTPTFYSVIPYQTKQSSIFKAFKTANEMLDAFYIQKANIENFKRKKTTLNKYIKKALEKLTKKLRIQNDALLGAEKANQSKRFGDLIMTHIYLIKRGMDKTQVTDYETDELVTIPLDKKLSPSVNAQKYYKRYNKLKKSAELNAKYIEKTKQEIDFLESTMQSLGTCETIDELSEVRYDLVKSGYINEKIGQKKTKATQASSAPHTFTSSDGFIINVGKNNRQNDMLTMKSADSDDMWMHTQNIPGAHVIIRSGGKTLPDLTMFEAAVIAASYSRAKASTKVPVDYTQRKNVKKPNGAKPGFVIYDHFETLIVDPDLDLVKQLKNSGIE